MTEKTRRRIKNCFLGAIGILAFAATGIFLGGHNIFASKEELPPDLPDFFDLDD
jgi:hypothetical protein